MHFTSPALARRIVKLLEPKAGSVVLDVGSGAGLFCVAAALVTPDVRFVGVEQRHRLVEVANRLADRFEVENASFVHGDALDLDWSTFDTLYFFNPFAEHVMASTLAIDQDLILEPDLYYATIERVQDKLARAPRGTQVVTYHGFGGEVPSNYVLVFQVPHDTDRIELWIKR